MVQATVRPSGCDLLLVALGDPAGRGLHAPADAVQQQIQPAHDALDAEPVAHDVDDPRQNPAPAARRRRTG
ncbi:hypothetical protein QC385_38555 [Streptomyces sp. DH10]|nr:hypothetical protein [Streptomyces sp. DH10]MDG9713984.1 hypothetical protein [Streptomyces sp. DH10]